VSDSSRRSATRVEVSDSSRALDTLTAPDYEISFELSIGSADVRTAEGWARACFEHAPCPVRWFLVGGWRFGLGLRLGPKPSTSHVLGWRIMTSSAEVVILEARSRLMTAHNLLEVRDDRVVLTTFVRYEQRAARSMWSAASPLHRFIVPRLLNHAAGRRA
jgi:hypothetical protein